MIDLVSIVCDQLGIDPRSIWDVARAGYRAHCLNGKRMLSIPNKPLRVLQNCLAKHFDRLLPAHPMAHGFVHGRSIVTAAAVHSAPGILVNLDLADWYGHITPHHVRRVLQRHLDDRSVEFVLTACLERDTLPQGAPTSPVLANAVAWPLDEHLSHLRTSYGRTETWCYSRFADDLTFSCPRPLGRGQVTSLLRRVEGCLRLEGQKLALEKLRLTRPHQSQRVQGIIVNANPGKAGVRLPREFHRRLRAALHNTATAKGGGGWNREQLRSAISLVQMVEPERAATYLAVYGAQNDRG